MTQQFRFNATDSKNQLTDPLIMHKNELAITQVREPNACLRQCPHASPTANAQPVATTGVPTIVPGEKYALTADAVAGGFATLVGALVGAGLAYLFQNLAVKRQNHRTALTSAHRTMFMVLQQLNTILLIQKDCVYVEINNPARYVSIMPCSPFDVSRNMLGIDDVAFLLEDANGRGVLYDLYIAQDNYSEALSHWNLRSQLHTQQVQPALEKAGFVPSEEVTLKQIDVALGPLLENSMKRITDNCIAAQQRSFEHLLGVKDKLKHYLSGRFPAVEFTDFVFPDTYGLIPPSSADGGGQAGG